MGVIAPHPNKKLQQTTTILSNTEGLFDISQPFHIKIPRIKNLGDELEKDEESWKYFAEFYKVIFWMLGILHYLYKNTLTRLLYVCNVHSYADF